MVELVEFVPDLADKVGKQTVDDAVEIDFYFLFGEVVMCEQCIVEAVCERCGKGSDESAGNERRDLNLGILDVLGEACRERGQRRFVRYSVGRRRSARPSDYVREAMWRRHVCSWLSEVAGGNRVVARGRSSMEESLRDEGGRNGTE